MPWTPPRLPSSSRTCSQVPACLPVSQPSTHCSAQHSQQLHVPAAEPSRTVMPVCSHTQQQGAETSMCWQARMRPSRSESR